MYRWSYFLTIDIFHILINFFIDHFHRPLKSLDSLLQLLKFLHHIFDFNIDYSLNKLALRLLQFLSFLWFMLKTGFYSVSLILLILWLLFFFNFILNNVSNDLLFNFILLEWWLKDFIMIELYDLDFLLLFIKNINDWRRLLIDFLG